MVTPLYSFMGIILLPYISEGIAKHELKLANRFVGKLALIYISSAILITAILYVFISFLTWLFFSESYLVTTSLSRIMIVSILPQAMYLLYRNPIDAVSVIPYNTIILGLCLTVMVVLFSLAQTLIEFAWAYVAVSFIQGILSWIAWIVLNKRSNL